MSPSLNVWSGFGGQALLKWKPRWLGDEVRDPHAGHPTPPVSFATVPGLAASVDWRSFSSRAEAIERRLVGVLGASPKIAA